MRRKRDKDMVRSTIRMLIPLEKQSEAIEILEFVRKQIQFAPSCLSSRLYRDLDETRAILFEEFWKNEAAMLHHLQSNTYRRVLLVIDMAEEFPEIRFETIAHSKGIEVIKIARGGC